MSFIKGSINFLDLNFHYFGYTDILDTYERGVFYQRGDLPITLKLQRPSKVTRFLHLTSLIHLGKVPWTKFPFRLCLTLFLSSLHKYCFFVSVTLVSFILKCYPLLCINFFYLKVFHQIRLNLSCANFQYTIFFFYKNISRLCSKKNWWEPSAMNLWYPLCPAYNFYEKAKIF